MQTGERGHQAGRHQPAQDGAQFRQAAIQQLAAEQPEVEEHEQAAKGSGETAEHHPRLYPSERRIGSALGKSVGQAVIPPIGHSR